jgi:hypothetical protein
VNIGPFYCSAEAEFYKGIAAASSAKLLKTEVVYSIVGQLLYVHEIEFLLHCAWPSLFHTHTSTATIIQWSRGLQYTINFAATLANSINMRSPTTAFWKMTLLYMYIIWEDHWLKSGICMLLIATRLSKRWKAYFGLRGHWRLELRPLLLLAAIFLTAAAVQRQQRYVYISEYFMPMHYMCIVGPQLSQLC